MVHLSLRPPDYSTVHLSSSLTSGKIEKIGDVKVEYFAGKLEKVGNVKIEYFANRVERVGNVKIEYFADKIESITGDTGDPRVTFSVDEFDL